MFVDREAELAFLFARAGATPAARAALLEAGGIVVDLEQLFEDLAEV